MVSEFVVLLVYLPVKVTFIEISELNVEYFWYFFLNRLRSIMKKGATKNCELSTSSSSILCGKGLRDWQLRRKLPKLRGTMHDERKRKH